MLDYYKVFLPAKEEHLYILHTSKLQLIASLTGLYRVSPSLFLCLLVTHSFFAKFLELSIFKCFLC